MADRHQIAARYGDHPPTCTCESCHARRLGLPDPKEVRRARQELTADSALQDALDILNTAARQQEPAPAPAPPSERKVVEKLTPGQRAIIETRGRKYGAR